MKNKETEVNKRTKELLSLGFLFDLHSFTTRKRPNLSILIDDVKNLPDDEWKKVIESIKDAQK